jgi:hypothetical protein
MFGARLCLFIYLSIYLFIYSLDHFFSMFFVKHLFRSIDILQVSWPSCAKVRVLPPLL